MEKRNTDSAGNQGIYALVTAIMTLSEIAMVTPRDFLAVIAASGCDCFCSSFFLGAFKAIRMSLSFAELR